MADQVQVSGSSPLTMNFRPGWKVIGVGWWSFEGFGRPFEAWLYFGPPRGYIPENGTYPSSWRSLGRAFTRKGARRRAMLAFAHNYGVEYGERM